MGSNLLLEGLLVFAVVAVLQLPGKSNFGVITLSTRHPHRDVFVGASCGLIAATVVSVTLGYAAETVLGPYLLWVKLLGGIVLIAFGVREFLFAPRLGRTELEDASPRAHSPLRVRTLALGLAFLLEMGDNTQILTIVFVASTRNVLLVFVAAAAALVTVTAISARGASYLNARIPQDRLRIVLGSLLVLVGVATILFTVYPNLLPATG